MRPSLTQALSKSKNPKQTKGYLKDLKKNIGLVQVFEVWRAMGFTKFEERTGSTRSIWMTQKNRRRAAIAKFAPTKKWLVNPMNCKSRKFQMWTTTSEWLWHDGSQESPVLLGFLDRERCWDELDKWQGRMPWGTGVVHWVFVALGLAWDWLSSFSEPERWCMTTDYKVLCEVQSFLSVGWLEYSARAELTGVSVIRKTPDDFICDFQGGLLMRLAT